MLLWSVQVCTVLSLLPRPGSLLKVSLRAFYQEPERTEPRAVIFQTFKRLHEIFHITENAQKFLPRKKPPHFMLDLFNSVADSNGVTRDPRILEGNIVRSFEDGVYSDRKFHFFNLSSFSKNERVIKAELRMFINKKNLLYGKSYRAHIYKVDVYEVQDNRLKPCTSNLISSRFSPLYNEEWEVFNVTKTVSKWIQDNGTNKGFLVTATLPDGKIRESEVSGLDGSKVKKSYLVIFSDDGRTGSSYNRSPSHGVSFLHADQRKQYAVDAVKGDSGVLPLSKSRKIRAAPHYSKTQLMTCQRRPLYVDFEKIGWSGWIISPRGYDAYYCKGSCPFPLGEGLRATNHATVQSIVHALKMSSEVETPSCVPDKLRSISLLYFDDEENVVLKQYDDMVVVSCGCH